MKKLLLNSNYVAMRSSLPHLHRVSRTDMPGGFGDNMSQFIGAKK